MTEATFWGWLARGLGGLVHMVKTTRESGRECPPDQLAEMERAWAQLGDELAALKAREAGQ